MDGDNLSFNEIPKNKIDEFRSFIKDLEDYGVNIYYSTAEGKNAEGKKFIKVNSDVEIKKNDVDGTYDIILSVRDGEIPKEAKYIKVAVNELPYVWNGDETIELNRTSTLVKVVINSYSDELSDEEKEVEEESKEETVQEIKPDLAKSIKVNTRTNQKILGNSLKNNVTEKENDTVRTGTKAVKEIKQKVRILGESVDSVDSIRDLKKYKNENEILQEKIRKLKQKYDNLDDRFKKYKRRRSHLFYDDEDKAKKIKSDKKYKNNEKEVVDDSDADLKRRIKSKNAKDDNYKVNLDHEVNDEDFNDSTSDECINFNNDDKQWKKLNQKKARRNTTKKHKNRHNIVDDEDDFKIFNAEENNYNEDLTNKDDLTLVNKSSDVSDIRETQNDEEDTYNQNQQEKTEKTISKVYLSSLFLALSTIFTYDKFGWLKRMIKF